MSDKPAKMTKAELRQGALFADAMRMIEFDVLSHVGRQKTIPEEWHEISRHPSSKKVRMTLYIEEDVVTFFRAMGPRYQPRMNNVLSAWVLGRLIGGPDVTDIYTKADELGISEMARPTWGEIAKEMDEARARLAKNKLEEEVERVRVATNALIKARERKREVEG